ncbi:hypothetical protein BKA70DRAFT_1446996 [Coprinopsis sp. MPI-PUGE-AT-0042]|nr:hypothetical protein BKA70DRAFT_1446996 [Coprinopsis sp. MPI-PUGE-AT-0042]
MTGMCRHRYKETSEELPQTRHCLQNACQTTTHPNTVQTAQRSDWLASSPHERDSPEIIIDLGPYVNCPTQTLIKEEDEKEHDVVTQDIQPQRSTNWDFLTRAFGIGSLLCNIAPPDADPSDENGEQIELQEDRKGTRTLQPPAWMPPPNRTPQPLPSHLPAQPECGHGRGLIEETWTNTSTRRLGIISTISQRSKAEVVFRIMEEPMVDPNTVIYLSTPIRYTKFTKDVGILSWISSNLFRRRSLKEPPTETVTETQAKAQRDAIQKRSNEMHTFPKRVKAGTRARTSSLGAEKALDHRKQLKKRPPPQRRAEKKPTTLGRSSDGPISYAQATAGTKRPTAHLETPGRVSSPHQEASRRGRDLEPRAEHQAYPRWLREGRPNPRAQAWAGKRPNGGKPLAVDEFDYDACYDSEGLEYLDDEERTSLTAPLTPHPTCPPLTPLAPVASLAKTPANLTFGTFPTRPPVSGECRIHKPRPPTKRRVEAVTHRWFGRVRILGICVPSARTCSQPGPGRRVTYYDGELPPHQIDRDDILESVPKETKEEWIRIPTNKVLVYFGSDKVVSDCLSRVEEIAHEVNRLTGSARGIGIRHIKMYPGQGPLILRDTVQPYLIHNLLPRQKEILVQKRMTNSNRAWIFFFDFNLPIRTLAFSISKIPIRDQDGQGQRVVDGIKEAFAPYEQLMADHLSNFSNLFPPGFPDNAPRRYKAWIRTIRATGMTQRLRNGDEEVSWNIYINPPHDDYDIHKKLIKTLKSFTYRIEGNDYWAWEDDYRCTALPGVRDHVKGLCPFRSLPGFHDTGFRHSESGTRDPVPQTSALLELRSHHQPQIRNASPGPSSTPARSGSTQPTQTNRGQHQRGGHRGGRGSRGRGY